MNPGKGCAALWVAPHWLGIGGSRLQGAGLARKTRGRVATLVLLVLFGAGCGSRVAPDSGDEPVAAGQTTASDVPADPASQPGADPVSDSGSPSDSGGATPSAQPSAIPSPDFGPKHNNGTVKLALSATCVAPGSVLVVTITAPPKAGLGMVIGYSDHQAHGAMLTGETDASGRYVWRVPVDPTVPDGDARVLVTATGANWEQEGGGTADKLFRVARFGC